MNSVNDADAPSYHPLNSSAVNFTDQTSVGWKFM